MIDVDTNSSSDFLKYTMVGKYMHKVTHIDHVYGSDCDRRDYSGLQKLYPYPVVFINPGYREELPIYFYICEENKLDVAWLEYHSKYDNEVIREKHPHNIGDYEVFHFKFKKHAMFFKLLIGE